MIATDNADTLRRAAEIVNSGGLIAFRTDTLYGLGVDPFNALAVRRIKELKGREDDKPILLLISDRSDIERLIVSPPEVFNLLADLFWPGPLTIIGSAANNLPDEITAGSGTVGVRLPGDEQVRELVKLCGGILTATSANPSGKSPAETAKQVEDYFPSGLDLIIDAGPVSAMQPSTVVDASTTVVRIVREGAISEAEIKRRTGKH